MEFDISGCADGEDPFKSHNEKKDTREKTW
jgi:hypothetical protein